MILNIIINVSLYHSTFIGSSIIPIINIYFDDLLTYMHLALDDASDDNANHFSLAQTAGTEAAITSTLILDRESVAR